MRKTIMTAGMSLAAMAAAHGATLTLNLSGDSYQGPPVADITVDGAAIPSVPVTAQHGQASQAVPVALAPGLHTVVVSFNNDAYAPGQGDRNLYLDSATLDGADTHTAPVTMMSAGTSATVAVSVAPPPAQAPVAPAATATLDTIHTDLQATQKQLAGILAQLQTAAVPVAIVPVVTAPPAPTEYEVASNLPTMAGQTINVPAGTELVPVHIPVGLTIQGAGMRASLADGQGGVDNGHRLAFGKGFFHLGAGPVLIQDFGFLDSGRNGNGTSDGETSAYAEGWATPGSLAFNRVSFDGQENGLFVPTNPAAANIDVIVSSSVFGRTSPNGLNDGRSHDIYSNGKSLTVVKSVFVGNSRGNSIKSRSADVTVTGSYIGASNGRWIDLPAHTRFTSSGNTYVATVDAGSSNRVGAFDEQDTADGATAGSYTSTDDTYCIGPRDAVLWNNDPAMVMMFVRPVLHWQGAAGSNPPAFSVQGPGTATGLRAMTQADRVDACPAAPVDPTP